MLGYQNIVSVFWTLGYEVQFYLVLVTLLGLVQRAGRAGGAAARLAAPLLFVPLAVASLLLVATRTLTWGWFIDWWYAFFLGACTWWTLEGRLHARWWALAALGTALAAGRAADIAPWTVLATACAILAVGHAGKLRHWLAWRPLQFLGRISYSLYLVHFIGTAVAKLGARRTGDAELPALGWFLLANAVSLALAWLLHRLVEAPSLRLARQPDPIAALRGWYAARQARDASKPVSGFAE